MSFAPIFGGFGSGGTPGGGGGGGDTDANFDDVALLADGTTTGVDRSKYAQWTSFEGAAAISGDRFVLGGGFLNFGNPGDVYDWSGNWTMELFGAKFTSGDTGELINLLTQFETSGDQRGFLWRFYGNLSPKRIRFFRSTDGSNNANVLEVDWSPTADQEYDLCIEQADGTIRFYVDGTMLGSASVAVGMHNSTAAFQAGSSAHTTADRNWDAGFAVARVTDGTARYGDDGGYTVPTLPLPTGDIGILGTRAAPGSWTWFNQPRAIAYDSKLLFGAVSRDGVLSAFEAASPYTDWAGISVKTGFAQDDHASGAYLRRASDDKLLAAYTGHNIQNYWRRISANANDASAWDAEASLDGTLSGTDYTYTQLVQLTGETDSPVYLFYRQGNASGGALSRHYAKSTDGGATFAAPVELVAADGNRPYLLVVQNGTARMDFAVTDGHPDEVATNSVYHFYYDAAAGAFKDTAGTTLTLPITPSTDLSEVYDGSTNRAWIWDIQIDGSGNPVILYTNVETTTDHRYRYARYNGSTWDDEEIVAGGGGIFAGRRSGGGCIDPDNINVTYLSIEDGSGIHQLHRYTKSGGSWSGEQLTTNMRPSFQPFVVPSIDRLLYLNGRYPDFDDFFSLVTVADIS